MRILSDALADEADFFVEEVQIVAIVFDNTDDATVWATTVFDNEAHFFHLALPFQALDTLLRRAAGRAEAVQEEVAEALAAGEWPTLLEYNTDDNPPVPLPRVALKLSITYPADPTEDGDLSPHNIFYLEGVYLRLDA